MNILLIAPPLDAKVPAKSTLLGLGYLASALRQGGHEVKIVDLTTKSLLDVGNIMLTHKFDTVGISIMFTEFKQIAINYTISLKAYFPSIHTIVGGAHASTFPEEMLEYADTVVVGEGEQVICDIVENRRTGIIRAPRIQDLDSLPLPSWDLLMPDVKEINALSAKSPFLMRRPMAHIITSRGCPNLCTYCAVNVAWGRKWVARSATNVVDEIEYLYNEHGIREFHFNDDNCSINKDRMYDICHAIIGRELDIKIACPTGIHIGTLDKDLLEHMKQAGFYRLCFGIETGNQEMQKKIKKNLNLNKARQVIKDANDLGFWTAATFIHGFPGETPDQLQDTIDFAKTSGLDFPIFYPLQIQPKTEMWKCSMKSSSNTKQPS